MPVGLPAKTTYANGDVFSASDINDTNGTINLIGQTNNFYAGKNRIINGDFGIWQRGTSFTTTNGYTTDRFKSNTDATLTTTRQTFTPGTAPVAGYEGSFFIRSAKAAGGSYWVLDQFIEDVRTFAGQTVTLSFWLKSSAATTIRTRITQVFGSGGSGDVSNTATDFTSTTSWVRYSLTFNVASISGKTIGTNSYLAASIIAVTSSAVDVDIWGVQLEAGSTATAFQTATGTIQGELAACQRYYERISAGSLSLNDTIAWGVASTTTAAVVFFPMKVTKRTFATTVDWSSIRSVNYNTGGAANVAIPSAVAASPGGTNTFALLVTTTGLSTGLPVWIDTSGTTGFLGVSAEL